MTGIAPAGFRLPAETHVGRVQLQVSDLDRSSQFYQSALGFSVIEAAADKVVLGVGQPLIELRAGATSLLGGRRLGLYHFAILLPDRPSLGSCLTHLLEIGIKPGASDHLVSEALYLNDPDGLGIEIYRDRPRSEWRSNGSEIAMSSEPLNFEEVLKAGEGLPWQSIPAGTTIGHVHLHVGNLDDARAFYHAGLGLDLVVWSYPGALFLAAGGYHHHLGVNTWAGPQARPASAEEPRLGYWELVLPTSQAVAAAVSSLGTAGFAPSLEEIGGSVVADPWGTELRLTTSN